MQTLLRALTMLIPMLLVACGGGGGGGTSVTSPSSLSYSGSTNLSVGAAASLTPTVTGTVTMWSVSPVLPAGLTLNTTTGAIAGTPTAATASAAYTITAANAEGQATATVQLAVALGATDASSANSAKLTAAYDVSARTATLSWLDTFASAGEYDVEQQNSDGSWSKVAAVPPGGAGPRSTLTWTSAALTASVTLRVQAALAGYAVTLSTATSMPQIQIAVPATLPGLVVSGSQPVTVPTPVSITGGQTYTEVDYFMPANPPATSTLTLFGTSKAAPSYSGTFDPAALPAGTYPLQARLVVSPDFALLVSQAVRTNPEISGSITFSALTGVVSANVVTTSDFGITQVAATLDGKSLGTLTAPNGTSGGVTQTYVFSIDTLQAGSGQHPFLATITDGNGVVGTVSYQVVFDNPPNLNVATPIDGAIVYGALNLTGTATTDKAGITVQTGANLYAGQTGSSPPMPIMSSAAASFSTTYDISSLTPRNYTLVVTSADSTGKTTQLTRTVTVASSANLVYTPVLTLGAASGAQLLAADQTTFLYTPGDGTYHLRAGASDTVLQNIPATVLQHWRIAAGSVFNDGSDAGITVASVFAWSPNGARTTLPLQLLVAVHDGWVGGSGDSGFTFYNLTTAQTIDIPKPAGEFSVSESGDFFLSQGQLVLYYLAYKVNGAFLYEGDIFRWDQSTGLSTAVTSDGLASFGPETDGVGVAWSSAIPGNSTPAGNTCPYLGVNVACQLNTLNIAGAGSQVLSAEVQSFSLGGTLLAWKEDTVAGGLITSGALKVYDGTNTTVLSSRISSVQYGSSGGYVLYQDDSQLYAWSPAGGAKLLFDAVPQSAAISGSTVYFTNGPSQTLYQVTLH